MHIVFKYNILLIFIAFAFSVNAQILDESKEITILLSDSTEVKIYKKANAFDELLNEYYYLPSHLKFSTTKNKESEFSLLTYNDNEGYEGAILHFLVTWGLTKEQREEAEIALRNEQGEDAQLMGAVTPELDQEHTQLYIKGTSPLVEILNKSATTIGSVPMFSNSKTASSFKLNNSDADTLKIAIENNTEDLKDIFLSMNFVIHFRRKHENVPHKIVYTLEKDLYKLLNKPL